MTAYLEVDAIPDPVRPQVLLACGTVLLALMALSGPPLSLWPHALIVLVLWPREILSAPERAGSPGARIRATTGSRTQTRDVRAGSSYLSQNDLRAHFGLGTATLTSSRSVMP